MGFLVAKRSSATVVLMAVAIFAVMADSAVAQGTSMTCLPKLEPCEKYVNNSKPPEECCKPLKDVVAKDWPCLCDILNSPEILKSLGIDKNQVHKLPSNCGISTPSLDLCNSTAAGSPSGSPGLLPGAPTPANGNSGVNGPKRVGLWGMSGLVLIWWFIFA